MAKAKKPETIKQAVPEPVVVAAVEVTRFSAGDRVRLNAAGKTCGAGVYAEFVNLEGTVKAVSEGETWGHVNIEWDKCYTFSLPRKRTIKYEFIEVVA